MEIIFLEEIAAETLKFDDVSVSILATITLEIFQPLYFYRGYRLPEIIRVIIRFLLVAWSVFLEIFLSKKI